MAAWLARRVAASVAIVFAVVTLTFVAIQAAPGTPFLPDADQPMDPAVRERLVEQFGLNDPLPTRYGRFLRELARGNLGESFQQRRPVTELLGAAIPHTLALAAVALLLDFALGIALGVYQATRAGRFADVALGQASLFLYSVPVFWLALVIQLVFAVWLGWFPVGGPSDPALASALPWLGRVADRLRHLVLPAATLGLVAAAGTARFQRAALLEVLGEDFVRTARAKGLSERRVVLRHALRNALLPFITLFGLAFPFLLTGSVLIETIFAWPGMGRLAADAIFARDYPMVAAAALVASTMVVLGSLLADVLYAAADPRIRVTEA